MGMACSTYGKNRNAYMVLMEKADGKEHQEFLDIGGRITLKWIVER
jgi:hypothetical protein